MSFDQLKVKELKKIAEDFGVEAESLKNKNDIISALEEEGVTWSVYQQTLENVEGMETATVEKPKNENKQDEKNQVLVRMTRNNFRYDIAGYTFTKEHPYVAMSSEKAQAIFDKEDGFRLATPKEVQDFYS
jgi:hypothetical protein